MSDPESLPERRVDIEAAHASEIDAETATLRVWVTSFAFWGLVLFFGVTALLSGYEWLNTGQAHDASQCLFGTVLACILLRARQTERAKREVVMKPGS